MLERVREAARRLRERRLRAVEGTGPLEGMRLELSRAGRVAYVGSEYEPEVVAVLERLVEPGFSCADVGAHNGFFTLLLARLVGERGRVTSYEAAPRNAAIVARNVELNGLGDRVRVRSAAVSDGARPTLELFPGRGGRSEEWSLSRDFAGRSDNGRVRGPAVTVPALSLDREYPPGSRLDLVKMDIEGAEAIAIGGMARLLREARPTVVLEFHGPIAWPAIESLREAGYQFETLGGEPLRVPAGPSEVPYQLVALPA